MEAGVTTCHQVIRENSEDRQALKIIISALTDKVIFVDPISEKNTTAIGIHAAMFGFLAENFGTNMVNPTDKNRKKTFERIRTFME